MSEQLLLTEQLKGCSQETRERDVEEALQAFKLFEKKNDLTRTLSGGQKRKLSVAIALIGGSKV